jgi:Ca2+-binding EF-hand superfamily protein
MSLIPKLVSSALIVAAVAAATPVFADELVSFATGGYASALRTKEMMKMIDTNHDGMVSKDEWLDNQNKAFDAIDTNKDGVLDKKEFIREDPPNVAFATAAFVRGMMTDEMFKKIDANGDGKITREEFIAYNKKIFDMLDKKKQGMVGQVDFIHPAG